MRVVFWDSKIQQGLEDLQKQWENELKDVSHGQAFECLWISSWDQLQESVQNQEDHLMVFDLALEVSVFQNINTHFVQKRKS